MLRIYPKFGENPWKIQDCTRNQQSQAMHLTHPQMCGPMTENINRQQTPTQASHHGSIGQVFCKNVAIRP